MRSILVVPAILLATSSGAQSFDAASEFSTSNNPTGAWSYGFRMASAATDLTLFSSASVGDLTSWSRGLPYPDSYPMVVSNRTDHPIFWGTDVPLQAGEMGYHPGPSGQFCVVRFTAPSAGDWSYTTATTALDNLSGGITVFVVVNGVQVFADSLSGHAAGTQVADSKQVTLAAGASIDFVCGAVGGNIGDTARLAATVRAVPAPASVGLLGLASLTGLRRRRA